MAFKKVDALERKMKQFKVGFEERSSRLEERFSGLEERFSSMENRFGSMERMMKKLLEMQSKAECGLQKMPHDAAVEDRPCRGQSTL